MGTKLTKAIIVGAEPRGKEYFIWDTEVRNFAVRIQPGGRKTLVYQYRFNRRTRRLLIGLADVLPLTFARDLAREAVVAVSRGIDPAQQREAARNAITVKARGSEHAAGGDEGVGGADALVFAACAAGMGFGLGPVFPRQQGGFAVLDFDRPNQFNVTGLVFSHSHSVAR